MIIYNYKTNFNMSVLESNQMSSFPETSQAIEGRQKQSNN